MINLYQGDCLNELKKLPDNSVDSLVTDPPAGISFMGKEWDSNKGGRDGWIKWMSEVMTECKRVMKPGAHGLVWAIPRTSHWTATALEDAGFEVRDVITHLFGSGFPKGLDISKAIDKAAGAKREIIGKSNRHNSREFGAGHGDSDYGSFTGGVPMITAPSTVHAKQWQGWGTALKPASEHWILVRKPLEEKTVAANVLKHGTGGINIDASRIEAQDADLLAKNWNREQSAKAKDNSSGAMGLKAIDLSNRAPQGRFPANLVLSHSPHCQDDQCDIECAIKALDGQSGMPGVRRKAHETHSMAGRIEITGKTESGIGDSGGASRFFYCAKISSSERNAGLDDFPDRELRSAGGTTSSGKPTMEGRDRFGSIVKNNHPTVKPQKLMRYLCRLITPPGGTVLDPFMGSGSTGLAARETGFKFVGIEKEPEYFEIASKRING